LFFFGLRDAERKQVQRAEYAQWQVSQLKKKNQEQTWVEFGWHQFCSSHHGSIRKVDAGSEAKAKRLLV